MIEALYTKLVAMESDMQFHMPKLREMAFGKVVTEIGFRTGVSSVAWLAGGCLSLDSIDIAPCEIPDAVRAMDNFTFHLGSSRSIGPWMTDILMIDGDHSYEGVSSDLSRWSESVGEAIVLHDTSCKKWPGVRRAMEKFLAENSRWRVAYSTKECYGLTILERQ